MNEIFAHRKDTYPMCFVASDLGLHCLPFTVLGVSRLQ